MVEILGKKKKLSEQQAMSQIANTIDSSYAKFKESGSIDFEITDSQRAFIIAMVCSLIKHFQKEKIEIEYELLK